MNAITTEQPSLPEAAPRGDYLGVEVGRVWAAVFVVYQHMRAQGAVGAVLDPLSYFAVPYFFAVTGFFFARKIRPGDAPTTPLRRTGLRIGGLFVVWSLLYSIVPPDWLTTTFRGELVDAVRATVDESWQRFASSPSLWLADGPPAGFHLWYLSAALCGLVVVWLGARLGPTWALGLVAAALFVFGLVGGRYAETSFGLALPFNTRLGPFQSAACIAVGWWIGLHAEAWRSRRHLGPMLFAAGLLLVVLEEHLLRSFVGRVPDNYSVGAFPLGAGSLLWALSASRTARERAWMHHVGWAGRLTLGIYLLHLMLRVPLSSLLHKLGAQPEGSAWVFLAVFAVSALAVAVMLRVPGLRRLVT